MRQAAELHNTLSVWVCIIGSPSWHEYLLKLSTLDPMNQNRTGIKCSFNACIWLCVHPSALPMVSYVICAGDYRILHWILDTQSLFFWLMSGIMTEESVWSTTSILAYPTEPAPLCTWGLHHTGDTCMQCMTVSNSQSSRSHLLVMNNCSRGYCFQWLRNLSCQLSGYFGVHKQMLLWFRWRHSLS